MSTMFFDGMEDKFQPTYLGMPTNVTQSTTNNTNDGGGKGGKNDKGNKGNKEVIKEVIYENGQVIVNFKKGGTQVAAWVPNETGESVSPENVEFYGRTQDLYEYYSKTGKLKEVTKLLIAANPSLQYALPGDPTYMAAFTAAVAGASGYNFQQTNGAPEGSQGKTLSIIDYLKKTGGAGVDGVDQPTVNVTGRKTAWDEYRSAFEQLTGKKASPASFNDFYKKLNAEERKYVTRDVGNTKVNERFDFQDFTMRYLLSQVKLTGNLKGGLGQYQNNIQQAIKDSGLQGKVSSETQAKYIRQMISGKMQPSDLNDILRKKASILYSSFAQDIKDNPELSVSEILDPYTQRYQGLLEIEGKSVDMGDVIRMASNPDGTKLSTWDYEKALKRDERYSYTQRANNEAINLAQSFAKSFGVNI